MKYRKKIKSALKKEPSNIVFIAYLAILLRQMKIELTRDVLRDLRLQQVPYPSTQYTTVQKAKWLELEDKVSRSISTSVDTFKKKAHVSLYYTNDTKYDIIVGEILDAFAHTKGGTLRGFSGSILRLRDTWVRTGSSVNTQFNYDNLKAKGYTVNKRWVYTYESKQYRDSHRAHDGVIADEDGYFTINGKKTLAPRLFGDPGEDYNCKCDIAITVDGH